MRVREIETVACLGTGSMGHGVAFLVAKAGYAVRMFGRTRESLNRGLAGLDRLIALYENHDLMPKGRGDAIRARVTPVSSLEDAVDGVDLVMESVSEDVEIKRKTYAAVEPHCRPGTIIATNTSGLSLSAISRDLARPEFFLSLHFIAPAHLTSLVEISPVAATLPAVRALGARWVESLDKVPVPLEREVQGFIVNRIQSACLREALYIVEQGWASAETVDKAVSLSLGRRYSETGPLETADMGGLDVFGTVLAQVCPELDPRTELSPLIADALKNGHMGVKSGKGLYDWTPEAIAARRDAREQSLITFMKQDQAKKA